MAVFVDLVRFFAVSAGLGDWVFSSIVPGCQSPAAGGMVNGGIYRVYTVTADNSQWEISTGAFNSGTNTIARTTINFNSLGTGTGPGQSGAGNKINFLSIPQVGVIALAEDLAGYQFFTTALSSDTVPLGATLAAIQRSAPATTALAIPSVVNQRGPLHIVDWSTSVTNHVITLTPNGAETIMRQSSWQILSSASQLGSLRLYPSPDLSGWVI